MYLLVLLPHGAANASVATSSKFAIFIKLLAVIKYPSKAHTTMLMPNHPLPAFTVAS
jgi:hypothetical protein